MKTIFAIIIIGAMSLAILSGCSETNDNEEQNDNITETQYDNNNEEQQFDAIGADLGFGTVYITSNGIMYEFFEQYIGIISGGIAASPVFERLQDIVDKLPVVEYADDFQLIIDVDERFTGDWVFRLFDSNLRDVCLYGCNSLERNTHIPYKTGCGVWGEELDVLDFRMPDESGEYILEVHVIWRNDKDTLDEEYESRSVLYHIKVIR